MRKFMSLTMLLAIILCMTACGGNSGDSKTPEFTYVDIDSLISYEVPKGFDVKKSNNKDNFTLTNDNAVLWCAVGVDIEDRDAYYLDASKIEEYVNLGGDSVTKTPTEKIGDKTFYVDTDETNGETNMMHAYCTCGDYVLAFEYMTNDGSGLTDKQIKVFNKFLKTLKFKGDR